MIEKSIREFVRRCEELASARVDYLHCGRNRNGLDCVGVIALPLIEMGVEFKDASNYARIASVSGNLYEYMKDQTETVEDMQIQHGDIGLFWFDRHKKIPQHACVFSIGEKRINMIHAYQSAKVVCSVPYSGHWPKRLTHVLRIPASKLSR